MRILFRRTKKEGIANTLMLLISVPLTFIRDLTTPMGEEEAWNRNRAAFVPMSIVLAFLYLCGYLNPKPDATESVWKGTPMRVGLIAIAPGFLIGLCIRFRTKVSRPPPLLLDIYAFGAFIMSIVWI